MKFIIGSDIHGSAARVQKLLDRFYAEKGDKLILLGDIYNHGPRNPLPEEYAPMQVAELLNEITDKLIVIKGNCDSEVDAMISRFDFLEGLCIVSGNKSVFCTHGHVYNRENPPKTAFDAVFYGHFHTSFITEENGVIYANPGSVSLPKGGTLPAYIVLEEGAFTLKDLYGNVISENR